MTRSARERPDPRPGRYDVSTGEARLERDPTLPTRWTVWLNGVPSSPVRTDRPDILEFEYLAWMSALLQARADASGPPRDLLHLGGAACSFPWAVETLWPDRRQVVVELDAELTRLVREWFDLPRSPRLRVQTGDARAGLARRHDASADVIVRDVFSGNVTPPHLSTVEFVADAARVLRPDGVYLANVADRPPLTRLRAELATALEVFDHVAVVAESALLKGRRYANAVVMGASSRPDVVAARRHLGRTGPAVQVLVGSELAALVGAAEVLRDR